MGRRRRTKVVKVMPRKLPDVFVCPKCGSTAVKVAIDKSKQTAHVRCSVCSLHGDLPTAPTTQPVDIYCQFSDMFYERKLPV